MLYFLENDNLKISADTHGAELHSIRGKKQDTEFLWSGDERFWKYHAPHLFPIIGKVIDSKYKVEGKTYEIPAHGIARISDFMFVGSTENSLTFELKYSEELLKVYPYKFSLQVKYILEGSSVITEYKVINLDDKNIYFSIGGHPAFMCPIDKNDKLEDCYLEFNKIEKTEAMLINKDVYISYNRKEYLNNTNILPLSKELFEKGLFIFDRLKSDKIAIKSKNNNKFLCVEFKGFPYVGMWSRETGSPFICIEPWFGHPDYEDFMGEFKDKEGCIKVKINESFNCSYKFTITE